MTKDQKLEIFGGPPGWHKPIIKQCLDVIENTVEKGMGSPSRSHLSGDWGVVSMVLELPRRSRISSKRLCLEDWNGVRLTWS